MKTWLKRVRGAVLLALAWAVVWAALGVLLGIIVDPDGSMDEMWFLVGAYPGFLCAVVFWAMLGTAESRRRFDDLPLSRVAAWGAASGLLVGVLPFVLGTPNTDRPLWQWGLLIVCPITLMSAASAVASASLARIAKHRGLRHASGGVA